MTYPLPEDVLIDRKVRVRMTDGVHLAVTVARPDRPGRFPVILCVTAYGKDFGPEEYTTLSRIMAAGLGVGTFNISDATTWEGPDPGFWVPNGYVVVMADPRGFYESEGHFGLYSADDVSDYAALIEWAGVQDWSNGSVGLNGVSYLAITQWMVASQTKPSHLKAIIPWEGLSDSLRDAMQQGGIPETRFLQGWLRGSLSRGAGPDIITEGPALMDEAVHNPFPLENIEVPALVGASWSNHGLHSRGSFEAYMRMSSEQKWLYTHGGNEWEVYYSSDALEWQKAFFDHFLKGEDNGFEQRSRVRLEARKTKEDYEVRYYDTWPPETARFTPLYLDLEHGTLTPALPSMSNSRIYDAEARQSIQLDLVFDRKTEVTGSMTLKLWVAAKEADDLDLFVALRKIGRDGREVHFCGKDGYREGAVAQGWLRVSQRRLDPERSKPWRPFLSHARVEKVEPGGIVPVEIEILPSSTLFEAGETLRLVVSGQEILVQARFGHDALINRGRHEIHAGGEHDSHLLIPLF